MKKLILIIVIIMSSCSNVDCDEEKKQLTEKYNQAIQNAGGSFPAIEQITAQYQQKMNELNERCN